MNPMQGRLPASIPSAIRLQPFNPHSPGLGGVAVIEGSLGLLALLKGPRSCEIDLPQIASQALSAAIALRPHMEAHLLSTAALDTVISESIGSTDPQLASLRLASVLGGFSVREDAYCESVRELGEVVPLQISRFAAEIDGTIIPMLVRERVNGDATEFGAKYSWLPKIKRGGEAHISVVQRRSDGKLFMERRILGCSEEELKRYRREVALVRSIDHPNVIKIDEMIEERIPDLEDTYNAHIIMEYIASADGIDPTVARDGAEHLAIAAQAASGLIEVHRLGGVHRDMKPENLLIWKDQGERIRVKVIDFGLAKLVGGQDTFTILTSSGTKAYMSREVLNGCDATDADDAFSLGRTLTAIALHQPFEDDVKYGASASNAIDRLRREVTRVQNYLSPKYIDWIAKLQDENPRVRLAALHAGPPTSGVVGPASRIEPSIDRAAMNAFVGGAIAGEPLKSKELLRMLSDEYPIRSGILGLVASDVVVLSAIICVVVLFPITFLWLPSVGLLGLLFHLVIMENELGAFSPHGSFNKGRFSRLPRIGRICQGVYPIERMSEINTIHHYKKGRYILNNIRVTSLERDGRGRKIIKGEAGGENFTALMDCGSNDQILPGQTIYALIKANRENAKIVHWGAAVFVAIPAASTDAPGLEGAGSTPAQIESPQRVEAEQEVELI